MKKFRRNGEMVDAFQWEGDVAELKRWLETVGIRVVEVTEGESVPGSAQECVVKYVARLRLEMPHHEWLVPSSDGIETFCPRSFDALYDAVEE
ncbi:hypothetical protein LCGC14_1036230 [marine sediment metagenome]|uniref:Uncharacterized protein n=1 Tax=marine sediment metagenome TaxID=412755 RepID=A0A0F9MXT2_9ZZZZ